jgi:hypothetical protein
MKWLTEFLRAISETLSGPVEPDLAKRLSELNPQRINIENVRSIMDVSTARARLICETAVRRGILRRQVLVLCPDDAVAASAPSKERLPPKVRCKIEVDGNWEEETLPTSDLRTMEVFSLNG